MEKLQIVVEVDSKTGQARIVELGNSIQTTAEKAKKALADAAKGMDALNKSGVKSSWSDQWNAGLQKATAMQKEAQAASKKLGDEIKNTGEKGRNGFKAAADGLSNLKSKMDPVTNAAIKLGGIFAGYKIAEFTKDTALAAARHETLGVVMEVVGRNAGYSAAQMHAYDAALQKTGISMIESRANLARLVSAHIDLSNATKLARAAQDTAVLGNINSSEAFERLVFGIQSAQVEVLRTIGINVNFENGYKRLANQLGVNTDQLTEQQKAQSRLNEVLAEAATKAGTYEAAFGTAGKQIGTMTRHIDDFKVLAGQAFGPALTDIVKEATKEITALSKEVQKPETREELRRISMTAFEAMKDLISVSKKIGELFLTALSGWNSMPSVIQEFGIVGALIGGIKTKAALILFAEALGKIKEWTKETDKLGSKSIKFAIDYDESRIKELREQIKNLNSDYPKDYEDLQKEIQDTEVHLKSLYNQLIEVDGISVRIPIEVEPPTDLELYESVLSGVAGNFSDVIAMAEKFNTVTGGDGGAPVIDTNAAKKAAEEKIRISAQMTDQIKRMTLSEYEYSKWALDQEVADLSAKAAGDKTITGQIAEYKKEKLEEIEEEHQKSLERQVEEEKKAAEEIKQLKADLTDAINQMTMGEFEYRQWALNQEVEALKEQAQAKQEILDQINEYQRLRQSEIDMERQEATFASEHAVMDSLRESWGLTWDEIRAGHVDVWADIGQASAAATHDIANGFIDVATGSKSAKAAARDMLRSIAKQAIQTLIQIGVQKVILAAVEKTTLGTATASIATSMGIIEAAAAPAAMMVSIASWGAASAAGTAAFMLGIAGMTGAYAGMKATVAGLSMGGAVAATGGVFDRPTLTVFGEEGPEAVIPLSPQRSSERDAILSRIAPSGSGESVINVDIGGIHFHGDVKLDASMDQIKTQIGNAVKDAIRGSR